MKTRSAIAMAVIIALSGCGAMDHLEQKDAANDTLGQIKAYEGKQESSKSIYIDKPLWT